MKKRPYAAIVTCLLSCAIMTGCGGSEKSADPADVPEKIINEAEEERVTENGQTEADTLKKDERESRNEEASDKKSLAQRMAGKYSYHYSDEDGSDEFYIMDVVPFGDNLYAQCAQAMAEDTDRLEGYSFWAAEFIPYNADEVTTTDSDTVSVNELCFSVMSNAGKYWNAGHKGTITLTEDGLVFEGFENDSFLVPEDGGSRLFLKDDRVEDAFGYLKNEPEGGDDALQGLWVLDDEGSELYLRFRGSDLFVYRKDSGKEVFYAAGGCEYSDGSFACTASRLGYGGMPFELSCDYKVTGDTLTLAPTSMDLPEEIPENADYSRAEDGKVPIMTMDEVELTSESFGMFGGNTYYEDITSQDYYSVFVSSSKDRDQVEDFPEELEAAGITGSFLLFTPDFDQLNPEPYYAVATGLYTSEDDADKALSDVRAAGFTDAYVKPAGSYIGKKLWYTMLGDETIELLEDGVMLRGVSVTIPYPTDGDAVISDLFVPKNAVFDEAADTDSFGNYESGDTPYEWIIRNYELKNEDIDQYLMYGPALSGVFEVGIEDNRITKYYGSYWWD